MRWAVLVGVLAGCNQFYGLDETQLEPQIPVTGQLLHRWVENDATRKPFLLERALNQTNTVYLQVRIGDETTDLEVADDGTFTFDRPGDDVPYQLVLTVDGEITEVHHDAPTIAIVVRSAGRLDPAPVNDATNIAFPVAANTSYGVIASTGVWGYATAGAFVGNYSFDWQKVDGTSTRHGLVDTTKNDTFYYFDAASRLSPENQPYYMMTGASEITSLVMTKDPLTLPVPDRVTATPCSKLVGPLRTDTARLLAAAPLFYRDHDVWNVLAIPDLAVGAAGAIPIASGTKYGDTADMAITPNLYNPIRGSKLVAQVLTIVFRFIRHPAAATSLYSASAIVHVSELSCNGTQTVVVPPPVGIPRDARLDGIALNKDDVIVPFPTARDVILEWTPSTDVVDWYSVVLYEVLNDPANDGTRLVAERVLQTAKPRLAIDRASLVRGRYYMVEISALVGLPDAKAGDLRAITYPFSGVQTSTGIFQIR